MTFCGSSQLSGVKVSVTLAPDRWVEPIHSGALLRTVTSTVTSLAGWRLRATVYEPFDPPSLTCRRVVSRTIAAETESVTSTATLAVLPA